MKYTILPNLIKMLSVKKKRKEKKAGCIRQSRSERVVVCFTDHLLR